MSGIKDDYNRMMSEIEQKITDPEQLEFIQKKVAELSSIFMETVDSLSKSTDERIKSIEEKIGKVEKAVNEIEADIYEDEEENFDFEIVCPYCDYEFVSSIEGKDEITCPNCNNVIELDWNEDEEDGCCSGHCHSCHGCEEDELDDDENDEDEDM